MKDVRDQFILAHAGFGTLKGDLHHPLRNPRRLADKFDFFVRFDQPLPVHQGSGIGDCGLWQVFGQRRVGLGRVIVVVHFHADAGAAIAPRDDVARQMLHRVTFGRLYEFVMISVNVIRRHPAGAPGADTVHVTPPPDRLALKAQQNPLVHVKGPAVIACQPCLV